MRGVNLSFRVGRPYSSLIKKLCISRAWCRKLLEALQVKRCRPWPSPPHLQPPPHLLPPAGLSDPPRPRVPASRTSVSHWTQTSLCQSTRTRWKRSWETEQKRGACGRPAGGRSRPGRRAGRQATSARSLPRATVPSTTLWGLDAMVLVGWAGTRQGPSPHSRAACLSAHDPQPRVLQPCGSCLCDSTVLGRAPNFLSTLYPPTWPSQGSLPPRSPE